MDAKDWIETPKTDCWFQIRCDRCQHEYTHLTTGVLYRTECPRCKLKMESSLQELADMKRRYKEFTGQDYDN